jgi:hypothetical protein
MALNMKVIGSMIKDLDLVNIAGEMEMFMKACGNIITLKV